MKHAQKKLSKFILVPPEYIPTTSKRGSGNTAKMKTNAVWLRTLLANLSNSFWNLGDKSFVTEPNAYPTNSPKVDPNAADSATQNGFIISAQLAAIIKLGEGSSTVEFAKKHNKNNPIYPTLRTCPILLRIKKTTTESTTMKMNKKISINFLDLLFISATCRSTQYCHH